MSHVLLVEDEPRIRRFVRLALESQGCVVAEAVTAAAGLDAAGKTRPDLLILDLGLPDRDGLELIRDLRAWATMPILVLSARSLESDKVAALDMGADDYLSKPFGVEELLARVRAMLRRRKRDEATTRVQLSDGAVEVDLTRRTITRNAEPVHLTPIEFRLLATLITHDNRVLTHRQLLREVWGEGHSDRGHYLRIYIGRLRHKLETDPTLPRHLLTETGVGYRFVI
jgi:two-component system, OmpR family, KDP operon response regulator KdpE